MLDAQPAPQNRPTTFSSIGPWLLAETPASRRVCLGWGVGALLTLLVVILCLPRHLVYDEVFHLTTVKSLFHLGLSREFLMGTPWSAPGPLYAFVQGAFAPLTGLRPPGIRLVNFACVLGMAALLAWALRARGISAPASVALGVLGAPTGWLVFAPAMTEAPAMLCAAGGILLTILWQRSDIAPVRRDALAVGAGLLLGAAVAGRQVFLAALPAIVLLARPGTVRPTCLQLAAASLFPAVLFLVWGGLTPPEMRWAGHGLRPSSAVLSYSYTGLTVLLLAPRFFSLTRRWAFGIAAFLLPLNLVFGLFTHISFWVVWRKLHFSSTLMEPLGRVTGAMPLILAGLFIASALKNLWERREDRGFVFACTATLALALTPIKITHVWDARYVSVVLPFLVVALGSWVTHSYARVISLTFGLLLAVYYLRGQEIITWNEENPPTMRQIFPLIKPND